MNQWMPIETAPKDGTPIHAHIPGHGDALIAWLGGLLDEFGHDCGGWFYMDDRDPPDCWTDGVCWGKNADGQPSTKPTRWKPVK